MSGKPMILNQRYKIEKVLGQGGLGVVYLAHDLALYSKLVAVKMLKDGIGQNAYWKRKFEQEKEALARCQNPHIVGVHDSGTLSNGNLFLVMEFVEGVPLSSVMKAEKITFTRVAHIVRQIGQALSYAHERAIFHRDLKPENIMLRLNDNEDFVTLIDFGIATVKESQPMARGAQTVVVGTPPYMAPEQIRGEPSAASDIFALGVVAYEMLTGQRPFFVPFDERHEVQWRQLYEMQRAGVKVKPKELCPNLSEVAQAAILKALAFDPNDRYSQARDFGEAFRNAIMRDAELYPTEPMTYPVISNELNSAEVVISYSGQDLSQALQLADHLKEAGIKCWMANHGHEANLNDRSETILAVKQCKVVLLLCSDAALRSNRVKQDLQFAWIYERPFLPCLIEPIDFQEQANYLFEGKQWIEVMNTPPERWLPLVLQALVKIGVQCSRIDSISKYGLPIIQPTRLDHSFKSLLSISSFTDQIWPLAAERVKSGSDRDIARGLGAQQEDAQHGYPLGSRVCLAIEVDGWNNRGSCTTKGLGALPDSEYQSYLMLLDQGPEEIIYCLCPSDFAPDTRLRTGRNNLPQAGSRYDSFVVTGKAGREHLLAIITDELLGLDWMPNSVKEPARILRPADIDTLLKRLRGLEGDRWTVLSTYFDVVS